ncbi:MAG: polysaccharide biosynthesis/export family protein [Bacteroidota bacterium]
MNGVSNRKIGICLIGLVSCLFQACTPQWLFQHKEGENLQALQLRTFPVQINEHLIQPDDRVTLSVWGNDELGIGSTFSVYSSNEEFGKYLVIDQNGEVSIPMLGTVKLAGLSAREANLYLTQLYSKYIRDPIVYTRVLNHQVTIMGEVRNPGNYELDRQRKSLLEVIGEANGFTDFADKTRLTIIRQTADSTLNEIPVDLTDVETLYDKKLILQKNDVIYVPERRAKFLGSIGVPVVSIAGGIITSVAFLLTIINR